MIRPAIIDDVPLIQQLIVELAEYERLAHEVTGTEALLRTHLFGPSPAAEVMIAESDGEGVGFALFFRSFSTFLAKPGIYLEDLFVRPSHRGRGIGKALLAAVARLTLERGYGRLEWSVLDWNEPALRLYRHIGAVPMSEWTVQRLTGQALLRLAQGAG